MQPTHFCYGERFAVNNIHCNLMIEKCKQEEKKEKTVELNKNNIHKYVIGAACRMHAETRPLAFPLDRAGFRPSFIFQKIN